MDLRQIKTGADDFGLMTYDPAFMNTANCRSAITYIDGDKGILLYRGYPIEQLAEESDFLETAYLILFGELPTARAAAGLDARDHAPHDAAREHQEVHGGLPVRRAPDGRSSSAPSARCRRFYPDAKNIFDKSVAAAADAPADRQGAEHRRLRLPPQHRPALHLSRQRSELHRQLPEHAVQDDRAEVPAEPGAGARARRAVHPARRSRAELQHDDDARRSAARTSIRTRRWPARRRRSTARCTAAPTKRCCGC